MLKLNDVSALVGIGQIVQAYQDDKFAGAIAELESEMKKVQEAGHAVAEREDQVKKDHAAMQEAVEHANKLGSLAAEKAAKANAIYDAAEKHKADFDKEKANFIKQAENETKQLADLRSTLELRESAVIDKEKALENKEKEFAAKNAELNRKLEKLRDIAG